MIDKRLIAAVPESRRYIAANVLCQWCSLAANIALMRTFARLFQRVYEGPLSGPQCAAAVLIATAALAIRFLCTIISSRMSHLSGRAVKRNLREQIYRKLLRLGPGYTGALRTSEVVQIAVEGVDQLETYFGAYLPQLFYAMLAPLTLFAVLSGIDLPSALLLLVCVPMIP